MAEVLLVTWLPVICTALLFPVLLSFVHYFYLKHQLISPNVPIFRSPLPLTGESVLSEGGGK